MKDTLSRNHPALLFLHSMDLSTNNSEIWPFVDKIFSMRNEAFPWPDYVFIPFAAWYTVTSQFLGKMQITTDLNEIVLMHELAVFGTWRMTQDIVRFEPDLYQALRTMRLPRNIPFSFFKEMPIWCIYFETPNLTLPNENEIVPIYGFWAMLEFDMNYGTEELRLFFLTKEQILISFPLMLDDTLSIYEALTEIEQSVVHDGLISESLGEKYLLIDYHQGKDIINTAINMLLYVCINSLDPESSFAESRKLMHTMLEKPIHVHTAKKSRLHIVKKMPGESLENLEATFKSLVNPA